MTCDKIITISRQFGSGGREIAEKLSEKLGVRYYDKELISLAAKESGIDPEVFNNVDERAANSLLYSLSLGLYSFGGNFSPMDGMPVNDKLYILQHKIIRQIAQDAPCIIVGRCADYILREKKNLVRIFIYADLDYRVKRAIEKKDVNKSKAEQVVLKTDKSRANYYNFYSGKKWGLTENYDLCINRSKLTAEQAVDVIESYLKILG